jgi:hypothetical protein
MQIKQNRSAESYRLTKLLRPIMSVVVAVKRLEVWTYLTGAQERYWRSNASPRQLRTENSRAAGHETSPFFAAWS